MWVKLVKLQGGVIMLHHPEYIVYMWFIPVFLAILLPLLAAHVIVIIDRIIAARKALRIFRIFSRASSRSRYSS